MTSYRGLPACTCLAEWLPLFEDMIGRQVTWWQLAGDAPASAGFHRYGGSADCPTLSESELRIARNMGAAAWNRWWANNYHAHMRLNGCPHNTVAQPQVADLNEGRDGTGSLSDNTGPRDNGPRDGVRWPLRTWREGIQWAREQKDPNMALLADLDAARRKHDASRIRAARVLLRAAKENAGPVRRSRIRAALIALRGIGG